MKHDGKEIFDHAEGHTFSRNLGTVGEFSYRYKCFENTKVHDKHCNHSGWDGFSVFNYKLNKKQKQRVCCRTSSNDYPTLATYCDKTNHRCQAVIIDGDEVLLTKPVDIQDTEFRGWFTLVKNYFPSELLFSDGLLKTDLVQGYSLAIMLGFEKMAHQFSINCEFRDDCGIIMKTRSYSMNHLHYKSAGEITGEVVISSKEGTDSPIPVKGEDCGTEIDLIRVDDIVIDFPGTHNKTMVKEVKSWMLKNDRCACKHRHQNPGYGETKTTNTVEFICERDQKTHEFTFAKPFTDKKFEFLMTNDLYAIQENSPVKRLVWKDRKFSWETVRMETPSLDIIRCDQIDPFYYDNSTIIDQIPFNLIGCLVEKNGKRKLAVYETKIINDEEDMSIAENSPTLPLDLSLVFLTKM